MARISFPTLIYILLAAALGSFPLSISFAQTAVPAAAADDSHVAKLFHPPPPLPSYEVATIKQADPDASNRMVHVNGTPMRAYSGGTTIKSYIRGAYGARADQLVLGGPAWISNDSYVIVGKPPAELQVAMQKMTRADKYDQERMMEQSLLAERFHLKVHFETRVMPVLELTPAKGGLKIKPLQPVDSSVSVPLDSAAMHDAVASSIANGGKHLPPGVMVMHSKPGSSIFVIQGDVPMSQISSLVQNTPEGGGRPVVDRTGITDKFYVDDLEWNAGGDSAGAAGVDDAPPLLTALEQKLGIKVTETKGPVEVLVIDSIDRPTEN